MSVIERVRQDREDLARVLKKHAGIRRIVEDLYPDTAHFIYELLQNAEDTGAPEAAFVLSADRLVFEHNGRTFDEADIRAITDIGEGTKAEDDEQIGRFGIGFKAVFAYTETPRIWSPSYAFEISEMVLPSEIPSNPGLGDRTRFEFPFNSGKKPQAQAFSEVRDGLEEISDNTLLFLSNIEEIQWRIDGGREGRLLRILHTDHHIEILREIDGRPTESANFLRFTESVDGLERQHAAVAFELEPVSGNDPLVGLTPFAKQFRIAPSERGCVAVYFTAAKETSNLRFHLHAPFVPELSRSSIKDTPANAPLFAQLAGLAARSLSTIRDLGMLDRDFLEVLPNPEDEIPDRYICIREAILVAMNEQPLTPVHSGDHAPAKQLFQASAALKALLDQEDLRFLTDRDDERRDWAIGATQRNSRVDRFLRALNIEEWDAEQFVKVFEDKLDFSGRLNYETYDWDDGPDHCFIEWLGSKPNEWHRVLYALLNHEFQDELHRFDDLCITRISDGDYRRGKEAYFPSSEIQDDLILPRVARDTYSVGGSKAEKNRARDFLEGIGVREVGEFQQVEAILQQRYAEATHLIGWKAYESDLRRFIALLEEDKNAGSLFGEYFIFQAANRQWCRANGIYLDIPYLETDLHAYFGPLGDRATRRGLSDSYDTFDMLEQFVAFARTCGAADHLEICGTGCARNPRVDYLRSAPGNYFTDTGIDRDYVIPELDKLFQHPTLRFSRLVWNTLCERPNVKTILRARYRNNKSNQAYSADSQIVHQLHNGAWIPQGNDKFVRPAEALRDLLPDEGFPFDPGSPWIIAIGFGAETEKRSEERRKSQEIAADLGFFDEAALADAQRFVGLSPGTRQRILADHESFIDLPEREPANRERRAESVRQEAREAPKRTTEKRQRSVSLNRNSIKREKTDPYLRDLYTNADHVTICQTCQDRLPFKLADGSYFFEAVEFLPGLKKDHHQNYLALCPNHAAMFMHANASKDEMKDRFLALDSSQLELTLADQSVAVYFTDTHLADLRVIIEVDGQD